MSALVIAASGSALVEQIGAYAGLASILGLGIMALLYFAQAREVKRLREWAGREPERAAEIAARVQADPQRRVVAQPMQPTTPAAQQQQATAALYASVGATPPGVAPAGSLARPAATPAAGLLPAPGAVPLPGTGAPAAPAGGLGAAAAGAAAAPHAPAAPGTPGTPAVPPVPGSPTPTPTPSPGLGGPAAGSTTTAPPLGAPAPGTAAAQRSGSLSAYANGAGQDTHESAAARPEPLSFDDDDDDGISGARVALFAGGGLAAVLVAIVLMVVLTGGDDTEKPNDFGNTPAQEAEPGGAAADAGSQTGAGAASSGLTPAERRGTKVAVLNGTTQTGLARDVGDKIEKARFTLGSIGTNADQQIPTTIIAFTPGHQPAARAVAKIVGVPSAAVQPADANASAAADADVVVTVGLDQTG